MAYIHLCRHHHHHQYKEVWWLYIQFPFRKHTAMNVFISTTSHQYQPVYQCRIHWFLCFHCWWSYWHSSLVSVTSINSTRSSVQNTVHKKKEVIIYAEIQTFNIKNGTSGSLLSNGYQFQSSTEACGCLWAPLLPPFPTKKLIISSIDNFFCYFFLDFSQSSVFCKQRIIS